jgi:hypothetical protein
MSTELEKLKDDLLALPPESRASLAHALIASLDEELDEDVETRWAEEIRRRDNDIKKGLAVLRPVDDVLRDARQRLRCMK